MSPRLERAALPKLLAHPAYRRHAKTEKLGNLASALASLVELENPPPHRDRNGSHGPTLSHNHVSVKLHHLWKCSKPRISKSVPGYLRLLNSSAAEGCGVDCGRSDENQILDYLRSRCDGLCS